MTIPQMMDRYRSSDRIALQCGGESVTYRELIRDAQRAARALHMRGIGKGDRVLLEMSRSANIVRVWLGAIQAGAVTVTPHQAWPESLRECVKSSCRPVLSITDEIAGELLSERLPEDVSLLPLPEISGEDIFQIFYTSGSTGVPKGVVTTHEMALARTCDVCGDLFLKRFCSDCGSLFLDSSFSFIAAPYLMLSCLLNGKTLILADDRDCRDARARALCILKNHADAVLITPSFFLQNYKDDTYKKALASARLVLVSTEPISPRAAALMRSVAGDALLCGYGCSEIGGCIMYHDGITNGAAECGYTNIRSEGVLYVLDAEGREAEEGELCIGGTAGAQGAYFGDADLTARKYITYEKFGRLLRTGDLAARQADGSILLRGRADAMIKVHGLRIEPGGIENVMKDYPGIENAAVGLRRSGDDAELCGWYTAREAVDEAALRLHIAEKLPYYMVPGRLYHIEKMPLTASGKLDRARLPEIRIGTSVYKEPAAEKERILCEVFSEILGLRTPAGAGDSFFELGGNSLSGMQAAARLEELGWHIDMKSLYTSPDISRLARLMTRAGTGAAEDPQTESALTDAQREAAEGTVGADRIRCVHPATSFMERLIRNRDAWMMIEMRETDEAIPYEIFRERLREAVDAHETLRSVFLCPRDGQPVQAVLRSHQPDVFFVDLRPLQSKDERISERQKRYFSGLALLDATGEKDFERNVLFKAGLIRVAENRSVIYAAYSHLLLDAIGIDNIMMELLGRRRITSDGAVLGKRELRLRNAEEPAAFAFWRQQPGFGKPPARMPAPKQAGADAGMKLFSVMEGEKAYAQMKAYCRSRGLTVAALVHHALAQALCVLLGTEYSSFSSISSGRTAEEIRLPGMFAYPYLFCAARGESAAACQKRLLEAQEHAWIFGKSGVASGYPGPGGVFLDMLNISADEQEGFRRLKPADALEQPAILRLGTDLINRDVTGGVSLYFDTAGNDMSFWGCYHAGRCDGAAVHRLAGLTRRIIESEMET